LDQIRSLIPSRRQQLVFNEAEYFLTLSRFYVAIITERIINCFQSNELDSIVTVEIDFEHLGTVATLNDRYHFKIPSLATPLACPARLAAVAAASVS
jgi:hypothetical protein